MEWTQSGSETFQVRKELFQNQKKYIENEIEVLNRMLDMIKFKCWYYEESIRLGDEQAVQVKIPNNLPDDIKQNYDNSYQ
ncbi:hypothetical protein NG812_05185 [Lactococcus garvieae]|jgi:hypothetical protein|uniref:Uncharacterized protein n=1 Tax=Lactococcus garvieae TaxID=1363 RepID=A0AAX3NDG5_9LACT|nr:hypothetical protein [Lactococcus garvieae]NHI69293.1 hypothetical protein [Lactococcus garvieae]NHJ06551.1 hypothetical protein [Lactococcus garvieae]WEA14697.1 hypothetical protein PWF74_04110 [Lactococcus garvieae]